MQGVHTPEAPVANGRHLQPKSRLNKYDKYDMDGWGVEAVIYFALQSPCLTY